MIEPSRAFLLLAAAASVHCGGSEFEAAPSDAGGDAPLEASVDAGAPDGPTRYATPTTIVHGETTPRGLALDTTRLFWVNAEDGAGGPGALRSALKSGLGGGVVLAAMQASPLDVALDSAGVFWSVGTGGGAPGQCLAMTLDKLKLAGATCVTTGDGATARLAIDDADVVLVTKNGQGQAVGFAPKTGGAFKSIATQGPSSAVAATDTTVYLGNAYGPHVDTLTLPDLSFATSACNGGCGQGVVADLTIDQAAGTIYWVTTMGQVFSVTSPPPTGAPRALATLSGTPQRLARDARYLYVTALPSTVVAVPVAGGTPITLASSEAAPFGIAVDETDVYWTCGGDGTIRAVGVPQ